jgi:hypothetical protein
MSDDVKQTDSESHKQSHKLGADRHDPAKNPDKEHGKHKTSKDIREDRGIRKHKLAKHKN